ncbi:hypothetical protein ACTA71_002072 [Dictyostelium dimigraforme]
MGELNLGNLDFSQFKEEKEMRISEIYDKFDKQTRSNPPPLDEISFANLKNQWLFFSKSLRGNELPNLYIDSFSKPFVDSISKIPEVPGVSVTETTPDLFEIGWNRNYKKTLFFLMNDDYISGIQKQLLDDLAFAAQQFTTDKEILAQTAVSCLKYEAFNFTKSMSDDCYCALISKEFSPSVSYEEFRETVNEVYTLNDLKDELLGFTSLWNYIYLKALSKKLSREIVNASMGSIIKDRVLKSFNSITTGKRSTEELSVSITSLLNSAETLKKSFGFKSANKKE